MLFCKHEWKILHTTPKYIIETFSATYKSSYPIWEIVICTCEKCWKIKKYNNQ